MEQESKPAFKPRVTRETRKPFGSTIQKLAYPPREGYHRHWFNDEPGRIDTALAAGYTHVIDKDGQKVKKVVGVAATGGPLDGYLMEIPEEWFQEDMARNQARNEEMANAIKTGSVEGKPGKDGRYIPVDRGIKIREGR